MEAPAPAPVAAPGPPTHLVVESVVCAAAERLQATPTAVREVLRAAFARARTLGLSVQQVDDALVEAPADVETRIGGASGGQEANTPH
jgi:hypothetical protein